jgi:AraC-like DNA-binding protein
MPVLPIPMIIALMLLALLVHRMLTRETQGMLLALIAASAVQSAIIALVQYYGISAIHPLQPLFVTVIPPIAWLAFTQAAGDKPKPGIILIHASGFALALLCLFSQSQLLDVLIPGQFAIYGVAMLLRLGRGEGSLPHSRLESGAMPLLAWRIIAISLIASAASDVMISYFLARGETGVLLWMPSVFSSLTLLSLGALSLSHAIESQHDDENEDTGVSPEDAERDKTTVVKVDDYVKTEKPFLDPDLTLSRLSRKLLIPAKQLSISINRVKGENVSRYINRYRIDHACEMIMAGKSVTDAMFSSGFNTKSNFNREFLRVKGENPSTWLSNKPNTR